MSITKTTINIAQEVAAARIRAHEKHGENSIEAIDGHDPRWLSILVEEVGEAAHELTYDATGSLRAELMDIITVAVAWVASLDREDEAARSLTAAPSRIDMTQDMSHDRSLLA